MDKRNEYDPLFSELKNEIKYDQYKKGQALHHIKTTRPFNHSTLKKKKQYTPFIISLTSIVVATCLVILLLNDQPSNLIGTSNIGNQPNETSNPELNENPLLTETHVTFDVENFGKDHFQLKNDILTLLSNFPLHLAGVEGSEFFDTVKIDENGVAIINFNHIFIEAYTSSVWPEDTEELMHALNRYVFSYNDVETAYYLLDGDASAWNKWVQIEHAPITRAAYEASIANSPPFEKIFTIQDDTFYIYGVTINQTKQEVIERLGVNYIEEKNIVIGGDGYFDRIEYKDLELTLIFHQNILQNAYVLIRDPQSFDRYFETFTGTKKAEIVDEHPTSMENLRTIVSNKGSNALNAGYDTYETLNIILFGTRQSAKDKITREFVEKNAKIGFSYGEVREVFGHEAYSGVIDNTMTFVYDSTIYYIKGDYAVAFDEIKNEQLDYQLYINFLEEKAVYYQYYFKGDDGEVWGYTISEQGDNLTRNSGN